MRKTILIVVILVMLTIGVTNGENQAVFVNLPEFNITLNGTSIENSSLEYPFIVYKDITYVPMTWDNAKAIGLSSNWSNESGLSITKSAESGQAVNSGSYSNNIKQSYYAQIPNFAIQVNNKSIDNYTEEYPLLLFRDITYFPMTWRFMVDEFGCSYNFDNLYGLSIISSNSDNVSNDSNIDPAKDSLVENNRNNTVEIHIIASQEDMDQGYFSIEIWEYSDEQIDREWTLAMEVSPEDAKLMYQPYIKNGKGTVEVNNNEVSLSVNAKSDDGILKYGYKVSPTKDKVYHGLVKDDLVIVNMRNALRSSTFIHDLKYKSVDVVFDIPEEYELLVPWKMIDEEENRYEIVFDKFHNEIYKSGVVVWGAFQDVSYYEKGEVDLIVFDYNLAESSEYDLFMQTVVEAYDTFMPAFKGLEKEYFAPKLIAGFVSEDTLSNNIKSYSLEGYRGAMILEVNENDGYNVAVQSNIGHLMTHWIIDDEMLGRMGIEGIADFGARYLDHPNEEVDSFYKLDMKERIRVYNEVIVANNADMPIGLKIDDQTINKIDQYGLVFSDGIKDLLENPDFRQYIYISDEYTLSDSYKSSYSYKMSWDDDIKNIDEVWFMYTKSNLVFYILNDYLEEVSDGQKNIYTFLNVYYDEMRDIDYKDRNQLFEEVYHRISGKDISGFTDKYIYGTEPLPIYLIDDEIVVGEF